VFGPEYDMFPAIARVTSSTNRRHRGVGQWTRRDSPRGRSLAVRSARLSGGGRKLSLATRAFGSRRRGV